MALVASLGVFLGVTAVQSSNSFAVVGGVPTSVEESPWQALVYVEADNRLCGGSIIGASWIVTAAHCVVGFQGSQVQAHVGITSLGERGAANQVDVAEVIVHPAWDAGRYRNDIALLRLSSPMSFGPGVQPIALPVGLDASQWPPSGTPARVIGWGATSYGAPASNVLRSGQVQILGGPADTACGRYGSDFDVAVEVCAGLADASVDACQGDSGSPLVIDVAGLPVLAGITSVGFECARVGYPGIYTRTSTFLTWVQEYLPSIASAPLAPQNVTVTAIAGERLLVEWLPPRMSPVAGLAGYQAVAEPGGASCSVGPGETACVIEGATAGRLYTVALAVIDAGGGSTAADPVQAVSVDGVASTGVRIRPRRLADWAGLTARKVDDIRLAVRPGSSDVCSRLGSRANPRGVRAQESGLCAVRVTVIKPNGKTRRSIAYVRIR